MRPWIGVVLAGILAVVGASAIGCSDSHDPSDCPPGAICDPLGAFYTIVFDPDFALVVHADPDTAVRGQSVDVEFSVRPLVDGAGALYLRGLTWYQDGNIGRMEEPVQAELGSCTLPVRFDANEVATVRTRIAITTRYPEYYLQYFMSMDSVLVDGAMCHVDSLCASSIIGLPPNNMGGRFTGRVVGAQ